MLRCARDDSAGLPMVHQGPADGVAVDGRGELGGDAAAVHHPDPVGEEEDLVEVLADQEDAGAAVAGDPEALVDRGGGAHVEAAARAVGDDDARGCLRIRGQ